jgi:predicted SAM-dependent methyltransferase
MKLNLGAGTSGTRYKKKEWVNLDMYNGENIQVIADGYSLPFNDCTFDEIHCVHVLEHLPRDRWPVVLEEIWRTVKFDAPAYVEVPDFVAMILAFIKSYTEGDIQTQHLNRTAIWGKSEISGMGHQFGFDFRLLINAMNSVGFDEVEQLKDPSEMISNHYICDGVILLKGVKITDSPPLNTRSWDIDKLRKKFWI